MLYGYNSVRAFPQQQAQLLSIGNEMVANTQDLMYPFFVIEFRADAANQCLGGSASCVNIAERLNCRLKQCKSDEVRPIDSVHGELDYYMRNVKSFLLQEPDQSLEFRKYVRNIID
ncbi:hypothetical protein B0O99DRAFT_655743 [Bisporella sp. PMI_857]|nr:hypothetical protein B0O99DRAFT_655743 [Bisporella sp. PMI_857]